MFGALNQELDTVSILKENTEIECFNNGFSFGI